MRQQLICCCIICPAPAGPPVLPQRSDGLWKALAGNEAPSPLQHLQAVPLPLVQQPVFAGRRWRRWGRNKSIHWDKWSDLGRRFWREQKEASNWKQSLLVVNSHLLFPCRCLPVFVGFINATSTSSSAFFYWPLQTCWINQSSKIHRGRNSTYRWSATFYDVTNL